MSSFRQEFDLIEWIRAATAVPMTHRIGIGIGDDAAVVLQGDGSTELVATDMLMEGTHFTFPPATPADAGRKALAVNLSDIAAMAGCPLEAYLSLALPRERGWEFAKDVCFGVIQLAQEFDVVLAGGDTNIWDGPLVINVCVVGNTTTNPPVTRAGARPGDWIFVTGSLGGSLAGHHLHFQPRVREAQTLARLANLTAMIDISDGFTADLSHILDASNVGAEIILDQIPVRETPATASETSHRSLPTDDRIRHALGDGEDFELLLTVGENDGRRLLDDPPSLGVRLTHVGHVVEAGRRELIASDGRRYPFPSIGWEHRFSP